MVVLMGLSFMLDKYLIAENFSSLHRTFLWFTIFILWYSWTFDLWRVCEDNITKPEHSNCIPCLFIANIQIEWQTTMTGFYRHCWILISSLDLFFCNKYWVIQWGFWRTTQLETQVCILRMQSEKWIVFFLHVLGP